jgi:hypothetical protein
MASTNLSKAQGSGSATNKFTLSFWVKRSVDTAGRMFTATGSSGDVYFRFNGDATIEWSGDASNASSAGYFITNRRFDDYSGWYHLVIRFDSTQGSASDRVRLYVNGVQEESFSSYTDVNQNAVDKINLSGNTHYIGGTVSSQYFHGLMSHIHYCDGYSYGADSFGSTDSTTGEWKITPEPSVTYGSNGYFILKDGATLTDSSPNSNNFAVANGTLTSTKDCPSNVYATWNPLNRTTSAGIQANGIANGNTYIATATSNGTYSFGSTLALKGTGKFYMEFKISQTGTYMGVGIAETDAITTMLNAGAVAKFSDNAKGWSYKHTGYKENGGGQATYGATYTANDYIGLAYNNGTIWFSKNGTWQNSATISEINAGTTTNAAYTGLDTSEDYFIMFDGYNDSMIEMNAGNGWFRTTEVSSPNNPTSGDTGAKFKYTVPTGYQPLSTKGLNL